MSALGDVLAHLAGMALHYGKKWQANHDAVSNLIERNRVQSLEIEHFRKVNFRLIQILSEIEIRCAPKDTVVEDGRVMRFVPPDPEFYWRELSAKVMCVREEITKAQAQEDTALTRVGGAK